MKMWMQRMQAKEEKFDMTIKEIAQLAQVSSAAVSRYLNGGYVSEEKKNGYGRLLRRPDIIRRPRRGF